MTLLGVVAVGESGVLAWHLFFRSPAKPPAVVSAPAAAPMQAEEKRVLAAAAEKSLLAGLAKQTPSPTPVPVTPASRVADLINLARALRERGDTGTAMVRLREAQAIYLNYAPIVSEMAITYEKMGLKDKAMEQWRRIYEMGEKAGIYYVTAEAKLRMMQLPDPTPEEMPAARSLTGGTSAADTPPETRPVLTLGDVGTTDDTGNSQPLRRLKLRVPIQARPGSHVEPREAVIQVFFYDQLKDGTLVETNANVVSSWTHRTNASGDVLPVDWSSPEPEVLEVEYSQPEFNPKGPHERRNYFGYSVRVYYKGMLDARFADPVKLLNQFIPPATLPSSDLPR